MAPIQVYLEALFKQGSRVKSMCLQDHGLDALRDALEKFQSHEPEIWYLQALALAGTHHLPSHLGARWAKWFDKLEKSHKKMLKAFEAIVAAKKTFRQLQSKEEFDLFERPVTRYFRNDALIWKAWFECIAQENNPPTVAFARPNAAPGNGEPTPVWDKLARELWYGGKLLKTFSCNSDTNQEVLLDKFQESNWQKSIDNPFSKKPGSKDRLTETLRSLNGSITILLFRAMGNGRAKWTIG